MRHGLLWLALLIAVFFLGSCETVSGGNPDAKEYWPDGDKSTLRSISFEIPIAATDQIPEASRQTSRPADYEVAVVPQGELDRLTGQMRADTGLLSDTTRQIPGWSAVDSWSYGSRPDGIFIGLTGTGSGDGSFAVRHGNAGREVLVDYGMHHSIAAKVDARAYYRGPLPEGSVLLFYTPFKRFDGTELAHVVAFEVCEAK